MQTYRIDDTMENFTSLKASLDARAGQYKLDKKTHTLGVTMYYVNTELSKIEYLYSFSTEEKKE